MPDMHSRIQIRYFKYRIKLPLKSSLNVVSRNVHFYVTAFLDGHKSTALKTAFEL